MQPIFLAIIVPHLDQVLGTDDQRIEPIVVVKDSRQCGGHQRLAQTNYIADQHAVALVDMMRRNFDCRRLKLEEFVAELAWNSELGNARARLLREMVRHVHIDMVRRNRFLARPRLLDDFHQLFRNVQAPMLTKFLRESLSQAQRGLVVNLVATLAKAHHRAQFFLWQTLHPNEQATAVSFTARPALDV